MRARRERAEPVIVRKYRSSEPGRPTVLLIHPGALPATVHRATAEALPAGVGFVVLDVSALPGYRRSALGEAEVSTLEELLPPLRGEVKRLLDDEADHVLAGWSFGGVLAHAMTVGPLVRPRPRKLVLLDSIAATEAYTRPDDELDTALLLSWFAMYLGARRGREMSVSVDALTGRDTAEGLAIVLEAAIASAALPADVSLPGLRKLYETYVEGLLRNNRLAATHRPEPTDVPVVLIKAERSLIPGDLDLGWTPLTRGGPVIRHCPGDHYTMLGRPDATRLIAEELGKI